jgi:hypothetical protein
MARSATFWFSRKEPDCFRSSSTSVVLPWSTCAMIAMLRRAVSNLKVIEAPAAAATQYWFAT